MKNVCETGCRDLDEKKRETCLPVSVPRAQTMSNRMLLFSDDMAVVSAKFVKAEKRKLAANFEQKILLLPFILGPLNVSTIGSTQKFLSYFSLAPTSRTNMKTHDYLRDD